MGRILGKIAERLGAGEVELGSEGGRRRIEAIRKTAEALDRSAERDRGLLAGLDSGGATIELASREEQGGGGTPSRISPESRSTVAAEFSSSLATADLAVQEMLDQLGPHAARPIAEEVRACAERLAEEEVAAFLEGAPWRTAQRDHWELLNVQQRAGWLVEALAADASVADVDDGGRSRQIGTAEEGNVGVTEPRRRDFQRAHRCPDS
jgi:hypothetical protein